MEEILAQSIKGAGPRLLVIAHTRTSKSRWLRLASAEYPASGWSLAGKPVREIERDKTLNLQAGAAILCTRLGGMCA